VHEQRDASVTTAKQRAAWREFQQTAGGGPDLPVEIDVEDPEVGLEGYSVVRYGRYWKLTYPDGQWQRTRTKRDAHRLAALHFVDPAAWTIAVKGDGAAL
jgi:hypothetical protein